MLDFELALMRALVHAGLAPQTAADELAGASDASALDIGAIGRSSGEKGTPVPGLLSALRERVGEIAAAHLHQGATSQDVVDTAVMLIARRSLSPVLDDLAGAADACATLAQANRDALEPGRTLLQQALPLTFGLKAAGWLAALDTVRSELSYQRDHLLAIQLGGAVGTLASLGDQGLAIAADMADQLGLVEPDLPWHTNRLRPAQLASSLAITLGALAKIARDVVLLAQSEVGEVAESGGAGRGGSSTMPHKRNQVSAVAVLACAERAPGLAATVLGAMAQEHERAAGAWQAESEPLRELLRLTGSAAVSAREMLTGLTVDHARMRANLDLNGQLLMSESVAVALAQSIGRARAQDLVEQATRQSVDDGRPLREVLLELPEVADGLGPERLDEALDPARYLGVTAELIDRTIEAHGSPRG
jgi:3-carboxy-cis,cis-muconate cycloisomerase